MQSVSNNLNLPLIEGDTKLPLVISVVLKYWGEENFLAESSRFKTLISVYDSLKIAEKNDFCYYIYKGSLIDIKKRIDQGIPPIVIFPGLYDLTQHAMLISGYDKEEKRIMTYIPKPNTEGFIPESKFESEWEQEDNITIILLPNDMKNIVKRNTLHCLDSNMICFEAENDFLIGNIDLAIEKLNKSLVNDHENAHAWSILGSCYSEKNISQAVICFNKAISINPRYYLAFRGLGNYYLKNRDYENSEKYYSSAIEIDPNRYGPIYKNRAFVRLNQNKNKLAKEDLILYLQKSPDASDKNQVQETINNL